uniref:Cell cycle checkpoint protein RAD17 n=1 Tax=Rhabditophanes sp. KR3021 TaxID=114890 RepID=A0AC35TT13_9BILA
MLLKIPELIDDEDVAMHPAKISEIRTAFQDIILSKAKSNLILLSGPSGSSKYSLIKVLSEENMLPEVTFDTTTLSKLEEDMDEDFSGERCSALTPFTRFLRNNDKCGGRGKPKIQRCLVIKQLPHVCYEDSRLFHSLVKNELKRMRFSVVVFCLTTSNNEKYKYQFMRLFTDDFVKELNIKCIKVNPIAERYMKEPLKRIIQLNQIKISGPMLKTIMDNCFGDIRKAVNMIWMSRDEGGCLKPRTLVNFNELSHDYFDVLGGIFYATRIPKNIPQSRLESENLVWRECSHLRRKEPTKRNLELLINQISSSQLEDQIMKHFISFNQNFACIRKLYGMIISLNNEFGYRGERYESGLFEYYFQNVLIPAIMFLNYKQVRPKGMYKFDSAKKKEFRDKRIDVYEKKLKLDEQYGTIFSTADLENYEGIDEDRFLR